MVLKHQYYSDLDAGFQKLNEKAKREISKIRDLEQHIYTLRQDDREIKEALSNAIESFCTIDDKKIIFKATQANLGLDAGLI